MKRLLPFVLRYKTRFAAGLACVLVTTSVALISPWILKDAVDDLNGGVTRGKLVFYATLILGMAIVGGCFRFLMRRIIVGISRHVEYDLRNEFFRALQRQPLAYFQAHKTGDLMSRATNDLAAVRMMIGPAVMYSTNTALVLIVAIVLMLSIDPWLTFIALIPMPLVSVAVKRFGSIVHRRFEQIQVQLSEVSAVVQEALSGVRVIKAYTQEGAEIERFRAANQEYVDRNAGLIRIQGFFYPTIELFLGIGGLLVLWLGSRAVVSGRISVGEFVAFNMYLLMLTWPMIAFGWVTNLLQRGMASWKRMLDVIEAAPQIADTPQSLGTSRIRGAIEFRNLTFSFGDRPILRDISFSVAAGQTVAIIGPTGSGKSTLLNLLPRLYEPPPQTVFIDGIDVRDIPLSVLRRDIGFVPQEPFLFSDTIGRNIAFGLEADSEATTVTDGQAKVEEAAAVARLDKDVREFPGAYETMVGERGITLSGGQKQRSAMARAIAINPAILILDDALSAVDTYTEDEILARLRGVMRERTSIIVSHRISTVRHADFIIVLNEGRIVERGTHDELIRFNGMYAELHRKQLLEEELEAS